MFGVQFNAGRSRAAIRSAIALLRDPTPMYEDMAEYLVRDHRSRFLKGVAPDGSAWAAKSESTLERYKRLGYGTYNSPLIGPGKRLSREIERFVSRDGIVIGSSLAYSGVMQDGAAKGAFGADKRGRPLPWGRIPARMWLGLSAENDAKLVQFAELHIAQTLDADA